MRFLGLLFVGCSILFGNIEPEKKATNITYAPLAGWVKTVNQDATDVSFFSPTTRSQIALISSCVKPFAPKEPEALLAPVFLGILGAHHIETHQRLIAGKEGFYKIISGTMMGEPVRVGAAIIGQDPCWYTFLFIATELRFSLDEPLFLSWLNGVLLS